MCGATTGLWYPAAAIITPLTEALPHDIPSAENDELVLGDMSAGEITVDESDGLSLNTFSETMLYTFWKSIKYLKLLFQQLWTM